MLGKGTSGELRQEASKSLQSKRCWLLPVVNPVALFLPVYTYASV